MTRLPPSIACTVGICAGLLMSCTSGDPDIAPAPLSVESEAAPVDPAEEEAPHREVFGILLPESAVERQVRADVGSFSSDEPLGTVRNHFRELEIPFRETHYPGGTAFLALDGTNREILVRRSGPRGGVSIDILREGRQTVEALEAAVTAGQAPNADEAAAGEPNVLNAGYGDVARSTGSRPTGLEPQQERQRRPPPDVRVVTETSVPNAAPERPDVERHVQGVERINRGTSRDPNVERPLNFPTINYEAPRNPNAYF